MANKQYLDVRSMMKDISDNTEFNKSLEKEIDSRQLSRILIAMRNRKQISQEGLATKIGIAKRKISRVESSRDIELTIGDLVNYSKAIGLQVEISFFEGSPKIVDRVKYHYFRIKKLMDKIVDMSKGDHEMELQAEKFSKEAFLNISSGLVECMMRATRPREKKESPLTVSPPMNLSEQEMAVQD